MPQVEIEEETHQKLSAFEKVVEKIMGKPLPKQQYFSLVVRQGLLAMLFHVVSRDGPILETTFEKMFDENPEFVSEFIANKLEPGEEIKKIKEEWEKAYL